ncbi:hypothetical protein L3X38_032052 [Prunus dulcis]|uniref:Uncharacterized protein n=1 Tax=Prunus dulcis TaxID=3755 RepID=A0AAD4VDD2_PRUDU|nr:hypothetical protein L3X38_032052 [Prunus dulcis]
MAPEDRNADVSKRDVSLQWRAEMALPEENYLVPAGWKVVCLTIRGDNLPMISSGPSILLESFQLQLRCPKTIRRQQYVRRYYEGNCMSEHINISDGI